MKIGILTLHSQTNYGGVIQAWALQQALMAMGFDDTVVVDRWLDSSNRALHGDFVRYRGRDWFRFALRLLTCLGDWSPWRRKVRTAAFLKSRLRLTTWHFTEWRELSGLDIQLPDCLVVGSDQVWHAGRWGDPRAYLLEGAPSLRAISYAASFGFTVATAIRTDECQELGQWSGSIPLPPGETVGNLFREGLRRFSAISCREAEAIEVCRHYGCGNAAHVVDPTLLAPPEIWEEFRPCHTHRRPRLFVYLLGESIEVALPKLDAFAARSGCAVDIFLDGFPVGWYGPFPSSPRKISEWWRSWKLRHRGRVRLCTGAGPEEFLRSVASSDWVVSDSFHALMFGIVFGRNVRMLRPKNESRREMFARIEEFAAHANGPLLADGLDAALASLTEDPAPVFDREWLSARRSASAAWLKSAISPKCR